ncbi:MAG: hypothetical protein ACLP01_14680 [Solirubrobacteraceae bacterium]
MQESPVQILEVRAGDGDRPVTITSAVTAEASQAIFTALSDQLDRRRSQPIMSAEDVRLLREYVDLVERFEPLATAGADGIVVFSDADLRTYLLELTSYADRHDGEQYQPAELRERLQVIAQVASVLWNANATAAAVAAGGEPVTSAAQ